jgi:hypothetical protein
LEDVYIDEINIEGKTKTRRQIHPETDPNFAIPNDEELMNSLGYNALFVSVDDIRRYAAKAAFERYWSDEQKRISYLMP